MGFDFGEEGGDLGGQGGEEGGLGGLEGRFGEEFEVLGMLSARFWVIQPSFL